MASSRQIRVGRWRPRYTLRLLLLLVAILCVWLGVETTRVRQQRRIVRDVIEIGGRVVYWDYDCEFHAVPAPEWLRGLIGDDYFRNIAEVDLKGVKQCGQILPQLATLPKLRSVILQSAGGFTAAELNKIGALHDLYYLDLCDTRATDAGCTMLGELRSVEILYVGGTQIGDDSLKALSSLPKLRRLGVWDTRITDAGLAHLSRMTSLRWLSISKNQITDEGLHTIAQMPNLEWLLLGDTPITDEGLRNLADMKNLVFLDLNRTRVTDEGLQYLSGLTKLADLHLDGTKIDGLGLGALRNLPGHMVLNLSNTNLSDDSVSQLIDMQNLSDLYAENTPLTTAGELRLRTALPGLQINR